jgi:hypothetical protein
VTNQLDPPEWCLSQEPERVDELFFDEMNQEIGRLRQENYRLRVENASLRRLVFGALATLIVVVLVTALFVVGD